MGIPWNFIFMFSLWFIWYCRNCLLYDSNFVWPSNSSQLILSRAKEAVDVITISNSRLKHQTLISWQFPKAPFVKINVDGSARGNPGDSAAWGVIRDSNGRWLGGFTYRVDFSSVLVAELWGIYHGLLLCWNKGFKEIILETDSLSAVMKVNNFEAIGPNNNLLAAIKGLLDRSWKCSIRHIYREENMCADWMATNFDNLDLGLHTFETPPHGITPLLTADAREIAWPRAI